MQWMIRGIQEHRKLITDIRTIAHTGKVLSAIQE